MQPASVQAALNWARQQLDADSASIDSEVLLSHVTGRSTTALIARAERPLCQAEWLNYQRLIEQRRQGMPVAYLSGHKEFWSLSLRVNQKVLIPRPDTEVLVEKALIRATAIALDIAELGTGSGAIALALASELPHARITASDRDPSALEVARGNGRQLGLGNAAFIQSDWLRDFGAERFDLIVSNPPYIAPQDAHLQGDIRFEPVQALVADQNGLADLFRIIEQAPAHLSVDGWLLLEHGYTQAEPVAARMAQYGFADVASYQDYAGNPRVTEGRWPGS